MAIKVNIGVPSVKKTKQVELSDDQSKSLFDKQVGDKIKGELIDMPGFEFEITGGSDKSGFPMRRDVKIAGRKRVLIMRSLGNRKTRKGMRLRKTVAGAIIYAGTAQVNMKVLKEGKQSLFTEAKTEAPAEGGDKPADAPAEEKKEAPEAEASKEEAPAKKAEEKPAKEEKPAEEAKPEAKAEKKDE